MKLEVLAQDAGEVSERGWMPNVAARVRAAGRKFPAASKGLLSIVDQAIVSGTSFLTAAIIGRATNQEQLGQYYFVLSIVLIVSGIQAQVVASPYMVYSKHRRGRELDEYAGSIWMHHLVFTLLSVAALLVAIVLCSTVLSDGILPGLWALLGAGPLLLLRDGIRRFTFANLRVQAAIVLDATVAAVQLIGLFLLARFAALSLFSIFATMGAACVIACVGWYLLHRPGLQFVRTRFTADWRHNWGFGKWALRSFLLGSTNFQIVIWILGMTVGVAAVGVLGACDTLVNMTNVVAYGVSNVLAPLAAQAFAGGGTSDLRRILGNTAMFLCLSLGGFCLFLLATGDWLAVMIFGAQYHGSGMILIILAVAALLNSLGTLAGNGLWAIDRPRANFLADVLAMVVTLVSAALWIPSHGALGAALTILTGTGAGAITRTITLLRLLEGGDFPSTTPASAGLSC